ncbi:MAG: polysaccharide deacetylase family protein [Terriglobales bacterium]
MMSLPPVVLMYHGVPHRGTLQCLNGAAFERHILFLKRNCTFIHPQEYASATNSSLRRPAVLLTFDDGFRNNSEVAAPILRRHRVPAVFFVCSRHGVPGRYLWFTYLRMLEAFFRGDGVRLNGEFISLRPAERQAGIQKLTRRLFALRPHPHAMYEAIESQLPALAGFVKAEVLADEAEGMTAAGLRDLAADPLFTIGAHTVDHPQLTKCSPEEVERQIRENKTWLERVTGKQCDQFSYPQADFDAPIVQQCRKLGFQKAYATESPRIVDGLFAIRRVGIYSTSLTRLGVKLWCNRWLPMRAMQKARVFLPDSAKRENFASSAAAGDV